MPHYPTTTNQESFEFAANKFLVPCFVVCFRSKIPVVDISRVTLDYIFTKTWGLESNSIFETISF